MIVVLAATSSLALDCEGAAVETPCDTLKDAKKLAEHYVSDDFARVAELGEPLSYARVVKDGVCVLTINRQRAGG